MQVSNKKSIRHNNILNILDAEEYLKVRDVVKRLNVSEMTIRRDLQEMSNAKLINVVNGVIFKENNQYHLKLAADSYVEQKKRIGKFAASLIREGDIIAIDTGSTTEHIAKNISAGMDITVICYNVNILNEILKKKVRSVIFAGGRYHDNTQMCESTDGISLISKYRANKAFISAAGLSLSLGATCVNMYETATKRALMNLSQQKVLVMDSSKFEVIKPAYFADLKDFNTMVTDIDTSPEAEESIKALDIQLYKA